MSKLKECQRPVLTGVYSILHLLGVFLWRHVSEDRGGERRIEVVNVSDQHGVTALGAIWRGVIGWLARTFGGIGPKHLQAYLDEYCFRVNVRADVFGTLLSLCSSTITITRRELVRKTRSVRAIRWTSQFGKKMRRRTLVS